ncbi:MAG: ABC transporter ATP-binding protein [Candidatus Binataceae bacterium]
MTEVVLDVKNLSVEFSTNAGVVQAVRDVSFRVNRGETLAIVGESGCGKSTAVQAILGLISTPPGRIVNGSAKLLGQELIGLPLGELNEVRGSRVGMIFQDPMTSLNPTMKVGDQIAETLIVHRGIPGTEARRRAVQLLDRMRVPDAATRAHQYPFEFSGGMAQRAMIALSLVCEPDVLIADEPTTALDVTIQDQVLELMQELQGDTGMSIVLITHDLGVVARIADRVTVMYAGQVIESGSAEDIYDRSAHPYTVGLRKALPNWSGSHRGRLAAIEGSPPDLSCPPQGCGYYARCPEAMMACEGHIPELQDIGGEHFARCWLQHSRAPRRPDVYQPVYE